MLDARELTKTYRWTNGENRPALDHLTQFVPGGEIFCLLGPNGAGKTTTINLFLNFIEPTSGEVIVRGVNAVEQPPGARRHLAYTPENVMLYGSLSGIENLEYFTETSGERRHSRDELLAPRSPRLSHYTSGPRVPVST